MVKSTLILFDHPLVSVVIPATSLDVVKTIDSIFRPSFSLYRFQVIVVLNNCDCDIVGLIEKNFPKEKNNESLKVYYLPKSTIGGARNKGIKEATGRYIVHIDSDCELSNDYLINLFPAIQKGFLIARGDVIFLGADNFFDKVNCYLKDLVYHTREKVSYTPNLVVNIDFHKEGFVFDDKNLYGEDTELSIRLEKEGITPIILPKVVLIHKDEASVFSIVKKYFYYGIARAYRYQKWRKKKKWYEFYPKLFGEIPSLREVPIGTRVGILLLYFLRDVGVIYGLAKRIKES